MNGFLYNVLVVSLSTGAVLCAVRLLSVWLNSRFDVRLKYWLWLVLAVRLLIPFSVALPGAPIGPPLPAMEAMLGADPVRGLAAAPEADALPALNLVERTDGEAQSPPAPASRDSAARRARLDAALTAVWLGGAILFLSKQMLGYWLKRKRLLRWSAPVQSESILARLRFEASESGMKRAPRALICKACDSPAMLGFFGPVLLLPEGIDRLPPRELGFVLRHEITHWIRRDLWYKLLVAAAHAAHWFNPMMLILSRGAGADLEISCDAAVIRHRDADTRRAYGEVILSFMPRRARHTALTTGFVGGANAMKARLDNLFRPSGHRKLLSVLLVLSVAALSAGSVFAATTAEADGLSKAVARMKAERIQAGFWEPTVPECPPTVRKEDFFTDIALPEEGDFPQEEALRAALEVLMRMESLTAEQLDRYRLNAIDFVMPGDGARFWRLSLLEAGDPGDQSTYIGIVIRSPDGVPADYCRGGRG